MDRTYIFKHAVEDAVVTLEEDGGQPPCDDRQHFADATLRRLGLSPAEWELVSAEWECFKETPPLRDDVQVQLDNAYQAGRYERDVRGVSRENWPTYRAKILARLGFTDSAKEKR